MANEWEKSIERLVAGRVKSRTEASDAIAKRTSRLTDNAKEFDEAVRTRWEPVLTAVKVLVEGVATADIIDKAQSASNGMRIGRTYGLNVRALPLPGNTDAQPVAMLRFIGDFDTGMVVVERPGVTPHAPGAPLSTIGSDVADQGVVEVVEKALRH